MAEIKLREKTYPLVFNMSAFEDIETSFGSYEEMMESIKEQGRAGWSLVEIITILVNGGLVERGEKTVTHSFVASALRPWQLVGMMETIQSALGEGMHSKMRDLDDEPRDVFLEENTKNGAGS